MKQLLIALVLFLSIITCSITGINFLDKEVVQLTQQLSQVETAMIAEDWPLVKDTFATFYDYWKEEHLFWHILLQQDELAELEANISRIYAFIIKEDGNQGLSELLSFHSLLIHLKEKEQTSWKNIL